MSTIKPKHTRLQIDLPTTDLKWIEKHLLATGRKRKPQLEKVLKDWIAKKRSQVLTIKNTIENGSV